jgi:hypothetical protein
VEAPRARRAALLEVTPKVRASSPAVTRCGPPLRNGGSRGSAATGVVLGLGAASTAKWNKKETDAISALAGIGIKTSGLRDERKEAK